MIHLVTDANGMPMSCTTTPANGDERQQVLLLLDRIKVKTAKVGRPKQRFKVVAAERGYDAKWLRQTLRRRGIRGQIPKRQWRGKKRLGRPIQISVPRFQQERCFAWLQRKYRRLVVRWERLSSCFNAFLLLSIVHLWLVKLVLVG